MFPSVCSYFVWPFQIKCSVRIQRKRIKTENKWNEFARIILVNWFGLCIFAYTNTSYCVMCIVCHLSWITYVIKVVFFVSGSNTWGKSRNVYFFSSIHVICTAPIAIGWLVIRKISFDASVIKFPVCTHINSTIFFSFFFVWLVRKRFRWKWYDINLRRRTNQRTYFYVFVYFFDYNQILISNKSLSVTTLGIQECEKETFFHYIL